MTNAVEDLANAGQAVKDGFEHVGEAIEKELNPQPTHEAVPAGPANCGPMGCDIPD
jgi:hypothetical protein